MIIGRVTRAGDGTPVADALVYAGPLAASDDDGSVITDASGSFLVDGLRPGLYKPSVEHDTAWGEAGASLMLGLGEASAPVDLRAHPAVSVDGTVVVAGGTPCDAGTADAGGRSRRRS